MKCFSLFIGRSLRTAEFEITYPKPGNKHYKWLGDKKPLSYQDKLRLAIDKILSQKPAGFDVFLSAMQTAGYEVKQGKHLAFRAPDQTKFTRLRSLGDGYLEQEIRAVIAGKKFLSRSRSKAAKKEPQRVNLLVDIQFTLHECTILRYRLFIIY